MKLFTDIEALEFLTDYVCSHAGEYQIKAVEVLLLGWKKRVPTDAENVDRALETVLWVKEDRNIIY